MRNQLARLGVSIGEVVLPPLNDLLEMSQGIIERMVAWTKEHPKLTKWLVIGGVALGAMAIAGGALLTAAAGLIGTMAVLRFGLVGLGARAVFAAGGLSGVGRAFRGLTRLPRFALSTLLRPVRWTARLIGRIPWVRLAGRLVISSLLFPFRWTSRFIPKIAWARMAGHLRWTSLIRPLSWLGRGALRFIPVIGWAALAGELLWHLLIKPLGWDEYLPSIDWQRIWGAFSWEGWLPEVDWSEFVSAINWPEWISEVDWSRWLSFDWLVYINPISWVRFLPDIPWANWFSFEWHDYLPDWNWSFIGSIDLGKFISWPEPPEWLKWLMGQDDTAKIPGLEQLDLKQQNAAKTLLRYDGETTLPTPDRITRLREEVAAYRAEVEAAEEALKDVPEFASGITNPLRVQAQADLDAAEAGLRRAENQLASAQRAAEDLEGALRILDSTNASPEISTESIDRALEKLRELTAQIQNLPSADAGTRPRIASPPKLAGARAFGGPVRAGLPYLVNERTPMSEVIVPSVSGGVLNVSQAQSALRSYYTGSPSRFSPANSNLTRLNRGAQGLRAASLAVLTSSALAAPAAAQGVSAGVPKGNVRVEINGGINVQVPSGVNDPEAIADFVADRISDRISATLAASHSD